MTAILLSCDLVLASNEVPAPWQERFRSFTTWLPYAAEAGAFRAMQPHQLGQGEDAPALRFGGSGRGISAGAVVSLERP